MVPTSNARRGDNHLPRFLDMAMALVVGARHRWTARELERHIARLEACPRALVRSAIRRLITQGLLEYSYTFGQSYLVISFRHPVDVGRGFTIMPPDYSGPMAPHRLPLVIGPGVSFGSGRHPTTRLALRALENSWSHIRADRAVPGGAVIDIGTGSGILAIAAARLGAETVMALDWDPCARSEAIHNIALNHGLPAITVSNRPLESLQSRFDLVIANLRLPTLAQLADWIVLHLNPGGYVVVSGVKTEELPGLVTLYGNHMFEPIWQRQEAGWTACVLQRKPKGVS